MLPNQEVKLRHAVQIEMEKALCFWWNPEMKFPDSVIISLFNVQLVSLFWNGKLNGAEKNWLGSIITFWHAWWPLAFHNSCISKTSIWHELHLHTGGSCKSLWIGTIIQWWWCLGILTSLWRKHIVSWRILPHHVASPLKSKWPWMHHWWKWTETFHLRREASGRWDVHNFILVSTRMVTK